MKQLLLILLSAITTFGQPTLSTVNVGTTANDGSGDTIRTALQKVNTNFTAISTYLSTNISATNISNAQIASDAAIASSKLATNVIVEDDIDTQVKFESLLFTLPSGGSAPDGTVINTGTPASGALPAYSDTTGTNLAPSAVKVSASTNLVVPGELGADALNIGTVTLTNAVGVASGGTGRTTYSAGGIPVGNGTNAMTEVLVQDTAYDADSWDSNTNLPTKNSLRDKLETLASGVNALTNTTDNTPVILWSVTTQTNRIYFMAADVLGAGPTNIYSIEANATAKNVAGTVTIIGTNETVMPSGGTNLTAYWLESGGDLNLYVRGFAGENVNWAAYGIQSLSAANGAASGSISYLIDQGFEGTGYDNGEVWTEGGTGSPEADSVIAAIIGSQGLRLNLSGTTGHTTSPTFAGQASADMFFRFHVAGLPASSATIAEFRSGTTTELVRVRLTPTGALEVRANGGTAATTVSTMGLLLDYFIWIEYTAGTGSDAVATVAFSGSGTKPVSGDAYQISNNGTTTENTDRIRLGTPNTTTYDVYYDHVLVDDANIGDTP